MATDSLKIKKVGEQGRHFLKLEGTILVYNQKHWAYESKLMIPVESIYTSEHPRFFKNLLIIAIIILIFPIVAITITLFHGGIKSSEAEELIFATTGVTVLLELGLAIPLIFNFLFAKNTIRLSVADSGFFIEFWKIRTQKKHIDSFLEQLKQRQLQVESDGENKNGRVFEIRNAKPKVMLFFRCILFCLPALIFQKYNLLILALIPIGLHFKSSFQMMKQPKEFRQALKYFRRKKWDEAIELLLNLKEQYPDYAPAMFLLLDTYVHAERFDEALKFSNEIPENYVPDSNALNLNLWQWKRMNMRRTESN